MSSPLAQDLAAKIIEVLNQRGHVLLSKGGRPALVRDLADRMNDTLATIIGRMPPPGIVDNEVTSTFGDEAVDDTVEEMVEDVTASLMDSDQVEDVFSEDAVIRRDVFRVVKETLLSAERPWGDVEEADVEVALETLGYVASKAAQRAPLAMVETALTRAAKASRAKLLRYSPETQTATFRAALATPDARLELEEAVADELSNLVDEGKVALPTIERRIALGRSAASDERAAARTRVDIAATRTLLRSGCTATWEYTGDDAITVSLVPMSDQDGRTVDPHVEAFSREVLTIFNRPRPAAEPPAAGLDAWLRLARTGLARSSDAPPAMKKAAPKSERSPVSKKAAPVSEKAPVSKKAAPVSEKAPVSKKASPVSEKAPVSKKAAPVSEKAPVSKKAAPKVSNVKKAAPVKKATAARESKPSKKAVAKKAVAKKPAGKKAKPALEKAASKPKKPVAKAAAKKARAGRG